MCGAPLAFTPMPAHAAISVEVVEGAAVRVDEVTALRQEAASEYELIATFFGMDARPRIRIMVADMYQGNEVAVSQAYPDRFLIIIPPRILSRHIVPLAHELTHVIVGPADDDVLSEGLGVFAQEKFGRDPAFPNFGKPLRLSLLETLNARYGTKISSDAVEAFDRELGSNSHRSVLLSSWINDMENRDNRSLAYLTAGSYVTYLIDVAFRGDARAFLTLYRSGKYPAAFTSADKVWADWLDTLAKG